MSSDLKPCPFCGGAARAFRRTCDKNTPYDPADRAFPIVRCGACGACSEGDDWTGCQTAIDKWNRRAQPAITSESGNQAAQGASAITSESAQAVPLLSDDELAALMPPPDIDGTQSRSPNAVRLAMRAVEQAVRAKTGAAQEDTDRLQWLADNMMMQSGYKNTGTWALPDLPWVASGRESCLIEDLRCVIDTHIEQSKLSKEGA